MPAGANRVRIDFLIRNASPVMAMYSLLLLKVEDGTLISSSHWDSERSYPRGMVLQKNVSVPERLPIWQGVPLSLGASITVACADHTDFCLEWNLYSPDMQPQSGVFWLQAVNGVISEVEVEGTIADPQHSPCRTQQGTVDRTDRCRIEIVSSHTLSFIIDWGTFPDWVAAVGTVGAFIAAVVIFGVTVRQNRLADRRSQARLFNVWVTTARWADYPEHSIGAVSQKLQVAYRLFQRQWPKYAERNGGLPLCKSKRRRSLRPASDSANDSREPRASVVLAAQRETNLAESGIHRSDPSWLPQDEHDLHGCKRKSLDPHVER